MVRYLKHFPRGAASALLAVLAGCGGGGGGSVDASAGAGISTTAQSVSVPVMLSDASSEDWATIGVNLLSLALVPQGGGAPVTIFTASGSGEVINLVQLDQIADILENATIPVGTYTGATLTLSANPGDVTLTTSADPETGFAAPASTSIPSSQIQIQNAKGASGAKTTTVSVSFDTPLDVTTTAPGALDLEFDLAHPAFLVGHVPLGGGATLWAVNFSGPVRQHHIGDLAHLVLRHLYGTVNSVSVDASSVTIAKDLPAIPVTTSEQAVPTGQTLSILADATHGTLYYDVDAGTVATLDNFSAVASSLPTKYVRVAARWQENGALVATRIWASSSFEKVWISPEGHVLRVVAPSGSNAAATLVVTDETGHPVEVAVNSATQFFFRAPADAIADTTPIGTGPAFAVANLVRGFKVHVSVVDPLAAQLTAQTVDIETARFDGTISNADTTEFTYTRKFAKHADDYTRTLDYIAAATANGTDMSGNPITGFDYWNFAFPTLITDGSNAINDFVAATNGGVNFGGTVGPVVASGASFAIWGDPANPTGWAAPWTVIEPATLPLGTVASGLVTQTNGADTFTMSESGGANPVTVDVSAASGSATLVYQVDRTNGVVTVSPQDITTNAGLTALTDGLAVGAPVRIYAVPESDGTLKAYVLTYYTGTVPSSVN
jgi:hypothetical protein